MVTDVRFQYATPLHKIDTGGHNHFDKGGRSFSFFMDFACGYPGSMHDARVWRRSTIFQRAEQKNVLTQPTVNVKPYPEGTRDPREITFYEELSSARVKVECAFGVLKSRWRILLK